MLSSNAILGSGFVGVIVGGIISYYITIRMIKTEIAKEIVLPFISILDEMYRIASLYKSGDIDYYFIWYFQDLYSILREILLEKGGLLFIIKKIRKDNEDLEKDLQEILKYIRAIQYEITECNEDLKRIDQKEITKILDSLVNTKNTFDKNIRPTLNRLVKIV